ALHVHTAGVRVRTRPVFSAHPQIVTINPLTFPGNEPILSALKSRFERTSAEAAKGGDNRAELCERSHLCGSRAKLLLPWALEVCALPATSTEDAGVSPSPSAGGRLDSCTKCSSFLRPYGSHADRREEHGSSTRCPQRQGCHRPAEPRARSRDGRRST